MAGRIPLERLCVVMDPRIAQANSEIHMASSSIIFRYPPDVSMDSIKNVVGKINALVGLVSEIRKTSLPVVVKSKKYKISARNFDNYFILMTSPHHLSTTAHINDFVLLMNSIKIYLGPLQTLTTRFHDNTSTFLSAVLSFIFQHTLHHSSSVFLNNLAIIPVRKNTPLKCQVQSCNLIANLTVWGGLVLYKKKMIYCNLPNQVVLSLLGLHENNIPFDSRSDKDNISTTKVYIDRKFYPSKVSNGIDTKKNLTDEEIDDMIGELDEMNDFVFKSSSSDEEYEMVSSDVSSDKDISPQRRHSQYSRYTEFFDGRVPVKKPHIRPRRTFSVDEQMLEESIASHLSTFSEHPGNSLAYKLFKSEEDTLRSNTIRDLTSDSVFHEAGTPVEEGSSDPLVEHSQPILSSASEFSKPTTTEVEDDDDNSVDSEYHDALPPTKSYLTKDGDLFLSCDNDDLVEMEAIVISRSNSRIIVLGEDILERNPNIKTECIRLLGELNAFFTNNVTLESKQKCTADVQSFVYDGTTHLLQQNHASKIAPGVTKQLMFCKDLADEEGDVDLLCVKSATCATSLSQKQTSDIYVSSRSLKPEKLADKLTDITIRNFNSLLL